ncbi:MAG: hypothetical protein HYU39_04055 [Thaumarchaeota archaeon]|nr:hypothetical protein [Nitrososphaerota archaeon]
MLEATRTLVLFLILFSTFVWEGAPQASAATLITVATRLVYIGDECGNLQNNIDGPFYLGDGFRNAGTAAEAFLLQFANQPTIGESAVEGRTWVKRVTEEWSPEEAGRFLREKTGLRAQQHDYGKAGSEFQKFVRSLQTKPELASRAANNLEFPLPHLSGFLST